MKHENLLSTRGFSVSGLSVGRREINKKKSEVELRKFLNYCFAKVFTSVCFGRVVSKHRLMNENLHETKKQILNELILMD